MTNLVFLVIAGIGLIITVGVLGYVSYDSQSNCFSKPTMDKWSWQAGLLIAFGIGIMIFSLRIAFNI